jgi:hypothetical protein
MPVSENKVLNEMMKELQKARASIDLPSKMKEHIRAVRLLANLLIDDESATNEEEVLRRIMEEEGKISTASKNNVNTAIDHDDANGTSIFDF